MAARTPITHSTSRNTIKFQHGRVMRSSNTNNAAAHAITKTDKVNVGAARMARARQMKNTVKNGTADHVHSELTKKVAN